MPYLVFRRDGNGLKISLRTLTPPAMLTTKRITTIAPTSPSLDAATQIRKLWHATVQTIDHTDANGNPASMQDRVPPARAAAMACHHS